MTVPQTPSNRFLINPEYSVLYRSAAHLKWEIHASSAYSFLAVFSGVLDLSFNGNSLKLNPGQSRILEPNTSLTASGKRVEVLDITISPALALQHAMTMKLIPAKSMIAFSENVIQNDTRLDRILGDLISELEAESPGKEIIVRALVEQLIVQLLRNYSAARLSEELELSRVGLVDRRIRRSVELMYTQLDQDLSLKDVAAASYLSPFHFARLFKKITGSTPHNYLAGIRSTRAQRLLAESDLSITEIAARVGYLSASHFTKAFRQATGTTPREFRKALINQN
ncbi:MAG TPA: AraC family transcriptional regulator [Pyrinomonadaceae bacterium]|nr:AraC family transcriptional regulator [Pyrinomonadaceae bacterium]